MGSCPSRIASINQPKKREDSKAAPAVFEANMDFITLLQFVVVLAAIFLGVRLGGIGIGYVGKRGFT